MQLNRESLCLYLVTDRSWLGSNSLCEQVQEAVKNGVTFVQLREKDLEFEAFVAEAKKIKAVCADANVPFIINDNIEVALAVDADGVHIGQSDMELQRARKALGNNKIIGVSTQTVELAQLAEKNGADYIGVGAVFSTTTKLDAHDVSYDTLKAICTAVSIPAVAIGGITVQNAPTLKGSGIAGIAVVSAILAQKDIASATVELRSVANDITN